jgi:hypothetical protein
MKAFSLSGGQEQGEPLSPPPMKVFSLSGGQEQGEPLNPSAIKEFSILMRPGTGRTFKSFLNEGIFSLQEASNRGNL